MAQKHNWLEVRYKVLNTESTNPDTIDIGTSDNDQYTQLLEDGWEIEGWAITSHGRVLIHFTK